MSDMVNRLLCLFRIDKNQSDMVEIDLSDMISKLINKYCILAKENLSVISKEDIRFTFSFHIRLLTVMGNPLTITYFHISKNCPKRRFFRTAGIDSKVNCFLRF